MRLLNHLLRFAIMSVLGACATKTVVIKSTDGAMIALANFDNLGKDEKVLGKSPVEVPLESVIGKAIRITLTPLGA